MSTRILEVSEMEYSSAKNKRYRICGNASETFQGIHPGDVLKVVDVDSGDILITGIMRTSPYVESCSGCMFDKRTNNIEVIIACGPVPCIDMGMMPVKLEDVIEQI